ncbi:MAG: universal stress protein [Gammaproteobacteria bacterium]|jgi:nucleotide-binding universal stress UspA family protein
MIPAGDTLFHNLLLAYDGSQHCRDVLHKAATLASQCGARVHLLSVAPYPGPMAIGEGFETGLLLEADKERYQQILDQGIAEMKTFGLEVSGHLEIGDAAERIATIAAEVDADLVIVGHHPRHGLERWLRASVGSALLDRLDCNLLIFQESTD